MAAPSVLLITEVADNKGEATAIAGHKIMADKAGDASQKVAVLVTTTGREITEEAGNLMVGNRDMVMTSVLRVVDMAAGDKGCMEEKEDAGQCLTIILEIMEMNIVTREKVVTGASKDGAIGNSHTKEARDMDAVIKTGVSKVMAASRDMEETRAMAVSKVMETVDGSRNPGVALQATRVNSRDVAKTGEPRETREMGITEGPVIGNLKEEEVLPEEVETDPVMVTARLIKGRAASPEVLNPVVHLPRTKRVAALRKARPRLHNDKF